MSEYNKPTNPATVDPKILVGIIQDLQTIMYDVGVGNEVEWDANKEINSGADLVNQVDAMLRNNGLAPMYKDPFAGNSWYVDPEYPLEDWRHEIADDNTRLGYEAWVKHQREVAAGG